MSLPERPLGIYVHHHGSGHANRCRLLAANWPGGGAVHVFTSAGEYFTDWTGGTLHLLPPDVAPDRDPQLDLLEGRVVHYAPTTVPGLRRRMAIMAEWIAANNPAWFLVDLSVEVALFARLCGVRVALMRLHGHRDDPAHRSAFGLADRLLAPFPRELEDAHTPRWVIDKTLYLGAFSRYGGRRLSRAAARRSIDYARDEPLAVIINGRGGGAQVPAYWRTAAAQCPNWHFLLVGEVPALGAAPANLGRVGFVADTFPYLRAADVVIGSGGTNTMLEIGAARAPYLSLPEPRPFGEQDCKMRALERLGLTRVLPRGAGEIDWPAWLTEAAGMDTTAWGGLFAGPPLRKVLGELSGQTPLPEGQP